MKISKYFLGMVMVSASAVGFTSCNDDDPLVTLDPVEKIEGEQGGESTLKVPAEPVKVKIGEDVAVPVEGAQGAVSAFSLNEEVAKVVDSPNGPMIQGVKNGTAEIMVGDETHAYKKFIVSIYTTDVMQLSHTSYEFITPLGISSTSNECSVVLGNGQYTIESDNSKVRASIDSETGAISMTATSGKDDFTANVTVHDVSGLEATIAVTVKATFDAFTSSDIANLLAMTEDAIDYNGNYPYYFDYYKDYGSYYGAMVTRTENSVTSTGFEYSGWSTYALLLNYPEGTALNTEVNGKLIYKAGYSGNNEYEGKIKILADNDEKFVGIYYNVDLEAEKINRGYVVWIKK